MRVKDTLKTTKEFFEKSLREKEESKSKIETQRLEKLARSMGYDFIVIQIGKIEGVLKRKERIFRLVPYVDSSQKLESGVPITTITLGGTDIVVDVSIH